MPRNNDNLRPLRPEDAEALRALYAYSLARNPDGFIRDPNFHGDIYARAAGYAAFLCLFDEADRLIGIGGLKEKAPGRVELCNLHVHPDSQGRGLGKALALALIDAARRLGYAVVELHVTATQGKAIGLYEHLGFARTDRKTYDVAGQSFDTIFMERAV